MALGVAMTLLAGASPAASLTDIRMHLFYEGTGRLSSDLTEQPGGFAGWNVIIGGGDAEEPANDLLIVAELQRPGEEFVRTPLRIVVTDAKGKYLASREFRTFLIPKGGRVSLPVWVPNVGCAGDVKVNVRFGKQIKTETIGLQCGE